MLAPRFLVIFEGRTGSSHLLSMLKGHPSIVLLPEELAERQAAGWASQASWIADCYAHRLDMPLAKRGLAKLSIGFKTKLRDIVDPDAFATMMRGYRPLVVRMLRRNRVKQAVSWIRAEALAATAGRFNVDRRAPELALPPFPIAPHSLAERLTELEVREARLTSFLQALALPHCSLAYEDLLADRDGTVARFCRRLGQPAITPFVYHRKHTSDLLREALPNWQELRVAFAGTRYAAEFDEDPARSPAERDAI